jgi:hypothetical protein
MRIILVLISPAAQEVYSPTTEGLAVKLRAFHGNLRQNIIY